MKLEENYTISQYDFTAQMFDQFDNVHFANDLWPIVYILSDGTIKEAYVGETTDTYARMNTHLKANSKNKLTTVHLIASEKFNKSATLDIESNLIKYLAGDGHYKLINGNIGLANHNFYQKKELYWNMFVSIWDKLRGEGISKHSLEYINNSDLFKYSPYKSLSTDQRKSLLVIMKALLGKKTKILFVEGGAGTGKTILAIFLFKLMMSTNDDFNFKEFGDDEEEFVQTIAQLKVKYPDPKMALVVPMSSFRNTLKKVFKNIKGLNASMVVGPSEITNSRFDIILVDESHRLRRRVNLGAYFGQFDKGCERLGMDKMKNNELDWVLHQSNKAVLFYDHNQSIKPSDVRKEDFDEIRMRGDTEIEYLKSQFRVKGGNDYVKYIDRILTCNLADTDPVFYSKNYEFVLFDSIENMVTEIRKRDAEAGLARLIAGYAWPWISKEDKSLYDIKIGDYKLQWNSVTDDFINSANAINEVGCIHTTQGYDLNYSGIIFGNEISYDPIKNEIVILKDLYFDRNGKQSITDPFELKEFIINIYKTILLRGIKGTYVYVCDPALREYLAGRIPPHITNGKLSKPAIAKLIAFENAVPVYDLQAAAGGFSELQRVENSELIALPPRYKASKDLFACRVVGQSMNKVIPSGSICLFRKYSGGSRNGKIVLVQHTSIQESGFGSGYTVKEYNSVKNITDDGWEYQSIILKPLTTERSYHDLVITEDELSDLKVVGIFECVLQ